MKLTKLNPTQLLDQAQIRWNTIGADQPDLLQTIALQRPLVERTIRTVDSLSGKEPLMQISMSDLVDKLERGIPALREEVVTLPVNLLRPLVEEACKDLARGESGKAAERVRSCLDSGRIDIGSLLTASFNRNQIAIRMKAMQEGIAPDVLWLASELAVGPLAYVTVRSLFTLDRVRIAELWPHGYCPACGSWPAFAEDLPGRSQLRCSFCGLDWPKRSEKCNYCGESSNLTAVKTDPSCPHRVELCSKCGAYLKWLEVSDPTPFELLPVEDLASFSVDVMAAEQGFGRPTLPDLGEPNRPPCEAMEEAT